MAQTRNSRQIPRALEPFVYPTWADVPEGINDPELVAWLKSLPEEEKLTIDFYLYTFINCLHVHGLWNVEAIGSQPIMSLVGSTPADRLLQALLEFIREGRALQALRPATQEEQETAQEYRKQDRRQREQLRAKQAQAGQEESQNELASP